MKRSLNMILQTKNKNPPISIKGIENRPIKKQILDAWKYCKFNRCVRVITSGWKFRKLTLETTSKLYFYNMLKGQDSWYSISQANANRQGLILSQPRRWQVHKMFKQWQGHKNVKIYSKKTNLDAAYSLILPTKASKKIQTQTWLSKLDWIYQNNHLALQSCGTSTSTKRTNGELNSAYEC